MKNMRIGIDARLYREAGVGRYIRNLIYHLQRLDCQNEYFVFLLEKDYVELKYGKNFQKVRADIGWYGLEEQINFPGLLKKYKLDLAHFPHFNVPVFYKGKFVVTIHDLIHQHFQMRRATTRGALVYEFKKRGYSYIFARALEKSERVITVSEYVRRELVSKCSVPDGKIVVTREAAEEKIADLARTIKGREVYDVLSKFGVRKPYLFYVGNAHPHKNVESLVRAFLQLKKKYGDLSLVLSGHDHYFWGKLRAENNFPGIVYTGYVSETELVALYKSAKVFVMPSLEEGFGIPILEAMACGAPVAASAIASLPEVGGDACAYFDPSDVGDIVKQVDRVLSDKEFGHELVKKGDARWKQFSFRKMAKQTLEVYESACGQVPAGVV